MVRGKYVFSNISWLTYFFYNTVQYDIMTTGEHIYEV
jgi:hypothetical protein